VKAKVQVVHDTGGTRYVDNGINISY